MLLAFPAALMFSGSLASGALAQLLSILLYCRVPITLQACLFTFLPLDTCIQTSPHAAGLEHSEAGKPVFLDRAW
jgi:hypothetical protein